MTNWECYYKSLFIYVFVFFNFSFIGNCFANEVKNITPKVSRCATCHTITGNSSVSTWPKLAGQHSDYMFKQLIEFKKGKNGNRFDPTMFGMLQGVSENELLELSEYFSKQILEKRKIKIDKKKFKLGKDIYLYGKTSDNVAGCVGCHGLDGMGNNLANFPSLRWQHKDYLVTQMKKFKSGDRSTDINSIMRDIMFNMSDDQMDAVAIYISSMN